MSQENLELVRTAVEAFNREDLQALAEFTHEEAEFVSVLTAVDAAGSVYRGRALWINYFARMHEIWKSWTVKDLQLFDGGDDRVASMFVLLGEGKSSGVRVERAVGMAYRVREGKLWRMRSYLEPTEALEAVGLRE